MGVPGKVREAIVGLRKWIRTIRRDPAYNGVLQVSADPVKLVSTVSNEFVMQLVSSGAGPYHNSLVLTQVLTHLW